ncbi:hypothetical protein [Fictibacillus arsenicus]|nr:hypothetical protein [Fictibacillus arsenicus]
MKFFIEKLIAVEGASLLRAWRSGETLKMKCSNVAHRLPRGKRATWNGN